MKHLSVKPLWVQEKEINGELQVVKEPRSTNWSDLLTHHWSEAEGERHLDGMGVVRRSAEGCEPSYGVPARGGQGEKGRGITSVRY